MLCTDREDENEIKIITLCENKLPSLNKNII